MAKSTRSGALKLSKAAGDPFKPRKADPKRDAASRVHLIREGVRCETEQRGFARPKGKSPLEIVVDASEGFVPLWVKDTVLRYRFRESSFEHFERPDLAKAAVGQLLAAAILLWEDAAPVKFKQDDDLWDFEIVMHEQDDCDLQGRCVLASAFFPDGGRHEVEIYPKMFTQTDAEQVETMAHEIGHVFGLRHFFAQVSETTWPSEIFGEHTQFSIMNYGHDSKLTEPDRRDLKALYAGVWSGSLTKVNGTPVKLVQPFHTLANATDPAVAMPLAAAVRPAVLLPIR